MNGSTIKSSDPTTLVADLEDAWNRGDGDAWGAAFSPEADFVDIRGEHHRGRNAIAAGHQAIFDTIYRGSAVRYEVVEDRGITPEIAVVIVRSALQAPAGPLAGEHRSTITAVMSRQGSRWAIEAFHNTLVTGR